MSPYLHSLTHIIQLDEASRTAGLTQHNTHTQTTTAVVSPKMFRSLVLGF